MGEGAAHEDRVGDPAALEVVHEVALAQQQLEIFDASYFGSEDRSRHGATLRPNRRRSPVGGAPTPHATRRPHRSGAAEVCVQRRCWGNGALATLDPRLSLLTVTRITCSFL